MAERGKICVVCGQDCSNRPRTKDSRGRYICGECAKKARSAKQPGVQKRKPPPAGDLMEELVAEAVAKQGDPCPECGQIMPAGAILCTRCGYNVQTGKSASTRVVRLKEQKRKGKKDRGKKASS